MMIPKEILAAITTHAQEQAPRECCGLLVELADGVNYWPCRNRAVLPDRFEIHEEDWSAAEDLGEITMVVHSHVTQNSRPSQADYYGCETSGLPWLIYSLATGEFTQFSPTGKNLKAPLIGREFVWGIFDCTTLVRDYYRDELGILFPDYDRTGYDYNFWLLGRSLRDKYLEAGFVDVPHDQPPQPHDIFLMQIRANVDNHAAVYLGGGVILQHLQDQLSGRTVYGGAWQKTTRYTMRHPQC